MVIFSLSVFYFILILRFAEGISVLNKFRKLEFTRLDGFCRGHNVPMIVNYQGVRNEGNNLLFNITTTVKEDIYGTARVVARSQRCTSKENLDTCEDFRDFKVNYCQMLDLPSLTPFYITYTPKLKCPFKKGVYRAVNSKMDTSYTMVLPSEHYYWRIKVDILGENERLLMCIFMELSSSADRYN